MMRLDDVARGSARWLAGFAFALACIADPARAAQQWIVPNPSAQRFTKVWKEGELRDGRDGEHAYVQIQTDGQAHPTLAVAKGLGADARGRFVQVTLRVRGVEHLAGLELRAGSQDFATSWYSIPIPMYADREYNFVQEGEWTPVTLSFGMAHATGAPDRGALDAIGLMVTDDGKAPVRVDVAGIALVDAPKEGVVSITFDDGYKEHLEAARLMAKRGWRGTAYVIPSTIGTIPAYLTLEDVNEIARLGFDVAAHEDPPFTQIPPAELEPRVRAVQKFLRDHGFGDGAQHLAYPLGKQEPTRVRPLVAKLFTTARIAGGGPETLPPADPHLLRAVNVIEGTAPEQVGEWARRAKENGEWLILMLHWLPSETAKHTDYSMEDYRRMLDAIAKTGVRVEPVTEVWKETGPVYAAERTFPPASAPAAPAPH